MVVFRFTDEHDKELLRELIASQPFAVPFGTTITTWEAIASRVSSAIGTTVNQKQVRDRLALLKKKFKTRERTSLGASGVAESLDACDVQSNYTDVCGLTAEYVQLERVHQSAKATVSNTKKKKASNLNRCAVEIIQESTVRRAERQGTDDGCGSDWSSDTEIKLGDTNHAFSSPSIGRDDLESDSSASTPGRASDRSNSSSKSASTKRSNAFTLETQRQAKRMKEELELRRSELSMQQERANSDERHFCERMQFEREQAAHRLEFERES